MSLDEEVLLEIIDDPDELHVSQKPVSRPWLSLALFLVLCVVYLIVSVITTMAFMAYEFATNRDFDIDRWGQDIEMNGLFFATCTLTTATVIIPVVVAMTFLFDSKDPLDYLGFRMPTAKTIAASILGTLIFIAGMDGLTWVLGRDVVPEFMIEVYSSAGILPLFWLALVVAAPLIEEIIFRGFLHQGLINSKLGLPGTAIVTSLMWAALHVQYDLYFITIIFVGGILLTVIRHSTGTIVPCIVIHGVMNLVATVEVAWLVASD